jgi:hypothetical protein
MSDIMPWNGNQRDDERRLMDDGRAGVLTAVGSPEGSSI